MQIAACYIRVSTDEQLEFSPDAQKRALIEYAKKNEIIANEEFMFIDEGISGRKAEKRPAFQRMISAAKTKPKPFDIILVHRFDRFSRNREDSVVYKSLLRKEYGIKVVSVTEQLEDDKFSVILEAMLEAMAEYYSLNLADEVRKGMMEKARKGGVLSRVPFGYTNDGEIPSVVENEAEIVKMIFQKIYSREMSLFTLSRYLNSAGILTRKGSTWSTTTLKQLLNNPFYTGQAIWNRQERSTMKFKDKSEWIIAEGKHTPIIEPDVFTEVQKILFEKKMRRERPNEEHCHWLSGLLKCSDCGSSLSAANKNSKYPFFQCHSYNKGKCDVSHYVPIHIAEDSVFKAIADFLKNPHIDARFIKQEKQIEKDKIDIFKVQLKKAEEKLARVKSAFSAGIDTLDEYRENKQKITSEIETLLYDIEIEESLNAKSINKKDFQANLYEMLSIITSDDYSVSEKNIAIKKVVSHIVFRKETKQIEVFYFL